MAEAPAPPRVRKWSPAATTSALSADGGGRAGWACRCRLVVAGGLVLVALRVARSRCSSACSRSHPATCSTHCAGCRSDAETAAIVASRVDRTVIGLVVGAAIALSGVVLQGLTRNPIAEPGILGLNSGAALAVVIGIRFLGVSTRRRATSSPPSSAPSPWRCSCSR